ncbi:hypothetical protein L218DRAFT_568406 [Marasmius fiardii PR-910]|nr:hypothetical protein L218DRAFT_568406 [Marasmius fiardii PR-910]
MYLVSESGNLYCSWDTIVRGLAKALPLDNLRRLCLSSAQTDRLLKSRRNFLSCFGPLANVDTIEVEGPQLQNIVFYNLSREKSSQLHSFRLRPKEREYQPPIDPVHLDTTLAFPSLCHLKLHHFVDNR